MKTLPHSDAGKYLREKYAREIEQDVCARIPLLITFPSTTTLGDIMETLFWCKSWEQGEELVELPGTLRHWSYAVSIKAEYLESFLTTLYGCAHGLVYEGVVARCADGQCAEHRNINGGCTLCGAPSL